MAKDETAAGPHLIEMGVGVPERVEWWPKGPTGNARGSRGVCDTEPTEARRVEAPLRWPRRGGTWSGGCPRNEGQRPLSDLP